MHDMPPCAVCGNAVDPLTGVCTACGVTRPGDEAPTVSSGPSPTPRAGSRSSEHGRFAPGAKIGDRFRIVSLLGRGGMGEVYRADDLKLGQPVALKFLPERVGREAAQLERFIGEVRAARLVSHPNVCRVYDIGDVDGYQFISMEYIDGEDLNSLLRRIGRLPEDKGIQIARQICSGLAAIHDCGLLHRDLKPGNVMIDGRGQARVTDFGLAIHSGADEREIAGTAAYMSPEQLSGGRLSAKSDLYAAGLVMFELFTGEQVHTAGLSTTTRASERDAAISKMVSGTARVDPVVQRVIARCLHADSAQRPPSAFAVAVALPGGGALASALAAGETPSPQIVAEAGDEGTLAPAIAIPSLIALLVAVALFAWLGGQRQFFAFVDFPHTPQTLATKAQEMLARLGYIDTPAGTAYGFARTTTDYRQWISQLPERPTDSRYLAEITPQIVSFWYRTSPEVLAPKSFFGDTAGGAFRVTEIDPPLTRAGMTLVELSPEGRLMKLLVVLPQRNPDATVHSEPDWSKLFSEAGLDMSSFNRAETEWVPPVAADTRVAWLGPRAHPSGALLRVEAASYRGRPVSFQLIAPWTQPSDGTASTARTAPNRSLDYSAGILAFAIPAVAIALAIRNIRLSRADKRGAARVAAATGLLSFVGMALASDFGNLEQRVQIAAMLLSWAALMATLTWVAYIAIEPDVRRRRPELLIAWTRLVEGRWRDALVGRAFLLGSLAGVARAVLFRGYSVLGDRALVPFLSIDAWPGVSTAISVLLQHLSVALLYPLLTTVFLILLRIVLRSEFAAALVAVVFLAGVSPSQPTIAGWLGALEWALVIAPHVILVWVALRVGLVALALTLFVPNVLSSMNVAFPHPGFLGSTVLLGLVAVLAPGVLGFTTSLARRRSATSWLD